MAETEKMKYRGEPIINVFLAFSLTIIVVVGGFKFILIGTLGMIITGIVLIFIMLFSIRKAIRNVTFGSDDITIEYLYGQKKIVKYNQCTKLYKANDGILPAPINVIKFKENKKEKKITFVCSNEELKVICDLYFNGFIPKFH